MVVTTIQAGISRKLNLGDFNSIDVSVTAWAQLEPGETMEDATRALQHQCATAVGEITRPFMKGGQPAVNVQVTEKFAGKPVNGKATEMATELNIK